MRNLLDLRRRGGKVVVINPAREPGIVRFSVPSDIRSLLFGSEIAGQYIQPHIGGDIAVLTGIAKAVVERGAVDRGFVSAHSDGGNEFIEALAGIAWEEIESSSGVSRREMEEAAATYSEAEHVIFGWTMGISTCMALTMSAQSPTSPSCAGWWAIRALGCCPFAGTATSRE
jgi:anaerobic selenocysteine-containing dehydrogenase